MNQLATTSEMRGSIQTSAQRFTYMSGRNAAVLDGPRESPMWRPGDPRMASLLMNSGRSAFDAAYAALHRRHDFRLDMYAGIAKRACTERASLPGCSLVFAIRLEDQAVSRSRYWEIFEGRGGFLVPLRPSSMPAPAVSICGDSDGLMRKIYLPGPRGPGQLYSRALRRCRIATPGKIIEPLEFLKEPEKNCWVLSADWVIRRYLRYRLLFKSWRVFIAPFARQKRRR